eukprot:12931825-Prorocentrum_lima.AAC.1
MTTQRLKWSGQDLIHPFAPDSCRCDPHLVHGRVREGLLIVEYVASGDNAAYALTKGSGAAVHRKARLLL